MLRDAGWLAPKGTADLRRGAFAVCFCSIFVSGLQLLPILILYLPAACRSLIVSTTLN